MAKLSITEYARKGTTSNFAGESIEVAKEPALRRQAKIDFSAGEAKSLAFLPGTRFVYIHTDTNCQFDIGPAPLATATYGTPISAGVAIHLAVEPGDKLSVIANG